MCYKKKRPGSEDPGEIPFRGEELLLQGFRGSNSHGDGHADNGNQSPRL